MSFQNNRPYQRITRDQALKSARHRHLHDPQEFPEHARYYYCVLKFEKSQFQRWQQKIMERGLRGEIAMAVTDPDEQILLHTKSFYPKGTFRIPTGGIHPGEPADRALPRELYEETGFKMLRYSAPAVVLYEFRHEQDCLSFLSFLYHVIPDRTEPVIHDTSEEITEFIYKPLSFLDSVIQTLHSLPTAGWRDWGRMRSVCHFILLELASDGLLQFPD
ncbi:MAG: NUDIX hydrolase [candidate division KSB1 bacterium]|nr:NUDIX hydrolase [candidate division KSB1 bacterium]